MTPTKRLCLTIALTAMWSPSFLFIKLAIQDLPPMTVAASRILLACLILYCLMKWKNISFPRSLNFWTHAFIVGLFSTAIPFCLFCYAEQTIDSSLAAILNGTAPMFTALLAQFFIPTDKLNFQKLIGILCCAAGLTLLFAPDIQEGLSGTTVGMLAAATAALCYAIHHVYGKKHFTGHQPFVAPTSSLLASSIVLWPFALWIENPLSLPSPSMTSVLGVCGLAVFGTVCAFILYYKLLEASGPIAISLVACFFPVGGILLGFVFLDETFSLLQLFSALLILLGMAIVNGVIPLSKQQTQFVPIEIEK